MFENRYNQLYSNLSDQSISPSDAFDELCHKYLSDDKQKDQNTFWKADFWQNITDDVLSSEAYIYALSYYFRTREISNDALIVHHAKLVPISFMRAIRYSKIFIRNQPVYQYFKENLTTIDDLTTFFTITDELAQRYVQLKNDVLSSDHIVMSYGYVDLLCLTSAFFIQFDYYPDKMNLYSRHGEVLSQIIQHRLKQPDIQRKKPFQQNDIKQKFNQYFKQSTGRKKIDEFNLIIEKYLALHSFSQDVLNTYCYDDNFHAKLEDTYIEIFPMDVDAYIKWYSDGLKTLHVLQHYDLNNQNASNLQSNLLAFLKSIYGFQESIEIENDTNAPLLQLYYFMQSIQENSPRKPLAYVEKDFFANIGDNADIEDFWSIQFGNSRINNQKLANLFEKPLFVINDFLFWIPYILSLQNLTSSLVNNLLRVRFQRTSERKEEVHFSEKNLGAFFEEKGFAVQTGFHLPDGNNSLETDLIAYKDGHLFLLELKSTYIRTNLEEAWIYKSTALRKATYQLKKRVKAIHALLENKDANHFINTFGTPKHIHAWIVDTSFEYDHELINGYLKISMFELIYSLENFSGKSIEQFINEIESDQFWAKRLWKPNISEDAITYKLDRIATV